MESKDGGRRGVSGRRERLEMKKQWVIFLVRRGRCGRNALKKEFRGQQQGKPGFKLEAISTLYIIKLSDFGAMSALTEIKKRIQEAKKEEAELTELDLTSINIGKFTPEISALIEKEDKLEVIILVDCSLTTLAGFPKCGFQAIDLSQNSLSDNSHIEVLATFPDLTQVFMANNKIKELSTIMKLKDLQRLIEVDFSDNPISEEYSKKVFETFPQIQFVDRHDREGNLVEDEDEGEFVEGEDDDDDDEEDYEEDEEDDEESYEEESEEKPQKNKKRK